MTGAAPADEFVHAGALYGVDAAGPFLVDGAGERHAIEARDVARAARLEVARLRAALERIGAMAPEYRVLDAPGVVREALGIDSARIVKL